MGQYETAGSTTRKSLWEYRVIDPMMIDKEGFITSADLGVGLKGKVPAGYGDWPDGRDKRRRVPRRRSQQVQDRPGKTDRHSPPRVGYDERFAVHRVCSHGKADFLHERSRYIGLAGYKYKDDFFVSGEYDITRGTDAYIKGSAHRPRGWHVKRRRPRLLGLSMGRMPFLKPVRILGRFDRFDHDDDTDHSTAHRWYYGVSYDVNKNVMFVLDDERTIADHNLQVATTKYLNENLMKVDVQWQCFCLSIYMTVPAFLL